MCGKLNGVCLASLSLTQIPSVSTHMGFELNTHLTVIDSIIPRQNGRLIAS
jgi:hypothetical protein